MAVYHWIVRPIPVLRFALGMKPRVIRPCGSALCGAVVWLRSPFDEEGCELCDRWHPDPALRGRSVIGLEIVRGLAPAAGDTRMWSGGTIYDPTSGRTYRAALTFDGEDRVYPRGYLGVPLLGRTTTWLRVGAEGTPVPAGRRRRGIAMTTRHLMPLVARAASLRPKGEETLNGVADP